MAIMACINSASVWWQKFADDPHLICFYLELCFYIEAEQVILRMLIKLKAQLLVHTDILMNFSATASSGFGMSSSKNRVPCDLPLRTEEQLLTLEQQL